MKIIVGLLQFYDSFIFLSHNSGDTQICDDSFRTNIDLFFGNDKIALFFLKKGAG